MSAIFSVLTVQMTRGRAQDDVIEVKGIVLKDTFQVGHFDVSRNAAGSSVDLDLSLSLKYDNISL